MMKTTTEMTLVDINKLIPYINNARTHSPTLDSNANLIGVFLSAYIFKVYVGSEPG